ncbi:MAG TPA: hypothetical protein VFO79_13345 [Xanthomonadales bacterium]|nr:hypothetical protein [Xanthomonadales bacterium]
MWKPTAMQRCVAGLIALLAFACDASAMSYVMTRDEALVDGAHGIIVADVVQVERATLAYQTETVYVLAVDRMLSPRRSLAYERLALPGSPPDALAQYLPHGVPKLAVGDRVLVPFERRLDGTIVPRQLALGLFFEQVVDGRSVYVRALDQVGDVGKGRNAAYHAPRDAGRFEQWITRRSRGAKAAVDYLEPDLGDVAAKFNLSRDNNSNFLRWYEFDADIVVSWTAVAGGQNGMVTDEFLQLQQALAAWTNDGGSKILLSYGGTVGGTDTFCDNGSSDGNVVLWNDPLGTIGGTFSCGSGGTLAVAGPCFFTPPMTYNGMPFDDIFEARLTVQDGAGCFFDGNSGANGAETLTHEIGHTLGFAHSCGDGSSGACVGGSLADEAVMRASAHGDGRGAALGLDDRSAAAFSYLAPGGAPPDAIFANGFE